MRFRSCPATRVLASFVVFPLLAILSGPVCGQTPQLPPGTGAGYPLAPSCPPSVGEPFPYSPARIYPEIIIKKAAAEACCRG